MNKTRHQRKKRMLNFSFCFPYLTPMNNKVTQSFSKQKTVVKKRRYQSAKKKAEKKVIEIYTRDSKNISSFQHKPKYYSSKRSSLERKSNSHCIEFGENLNNTEQLNAKAKPFGLTEMVQFDVSQLVRRKIDVKKQQQKVIDIDNFQSVLAKKFQIPGVSFKKSEGNKPIKQRYQTIDYLQQSSQDFNNSQIIERNLSKKSNAKWNQQRLINIEFIIKSKCKDFQGIISEYYQRTQNQKASFIFVFDSKDAWMKRVLLKRGWSQNTNKLSRAFHLLWSYKYPKEMKLFPEQLVNHYPNSFKLTTKAGLHSLLKEYNLSHLQPKTYDIDKEKDSFIVEYEKISFLRDIKEIILLLQFQQKPTRIQSNQLKTKIEQCLNMAMQNPEEEYFQRQIKYLLQKCLEFLQHSSSFQYRASSLGSIIKIMQEKQSLQPRHAEIFNLLRKFQYFVENNGVIQNLNEGGYNNIWIVKSQFSSKGAGMYLSNDLSTIVRQENRLIQKYIENVLILQEFKNRKFDLRVWVLVVGGKSCKIYYNQQFYGRFCFQSYSLDQKFLKNNAVHLTNYTINKNSYRQFNSKSVSVLFPEQLFSQIQKQYKISYKDIYYNKLQGMLSQLVQVFKKQICAEASSSNFQLFGVDLLIDYKLDLHLLQINLSAQCQQRHEKLSQMLQQMGEGLLNILEGKEDIRKWRPIY